MAKKSNKDNSNLPVQRLDSNSTNLIDKIVSEKDPGKLKDLVDLFNFNQNKKDILRADTYSKLLDKLSEEMYNRELIEELLLLQTMNLWSSIRQ